MKFIYPAVFHEENGSFWCEFPDIEGCFSDGETFAEVLENAKQALSIHCEYVIESNGCLPEATSIENVEKTKDGWVSLVEAELAVTSKLIKKVIAVPTRLIELAEAKELDLSVILQNALLRELDITGSI